MRANGKRNFRSGSLRDAARRMARPRSAPGPAADGWWRALAAVLLLVALVSLLRSVGREVLADSPASSRWVADRPLQSIDVQKGIARMPMPERAGAATGRPWEPVTAPLGTQTASPALDVGVTLESASEPWSLGRWIDQAETLIRQYPWPTIGVGVVLGFILAKRMR